MVYIGPSPLSAELTHASLILTLDLWLRRLSDNGGRSMAARRPPERPCAYAVEVTFSGSNSAPCFQTARVMAAILRATVKYPRWALIEAVNHMGGQTPSGQVRDRLRLSRSRSTAKAATARRLLRQIYYCLKAYDAQTC